MLEDVAMSTAARQLGLSPGMLELAVQLAEVRTVRPGRSGRGVGGARAVRTAAAGGRLPRRVPRTEVARLRAAEDFPDGLRKRLRVVDAEGGARLLGVTASRFARLARGGCFSPVRFYVNRYGSVVWLYPQTELHTFAGNRPELLSGRLPRGLRELLAEGVDLRAGHWRGRRIRMLCREADGPWESAAVRAALLTEGALAEAVPDAGERARLRALRPELAPYRARSAAVRQTVAELCKAAGEDEVFWQRLMLAADLEHARASEQAAGPAGAVGPAPLSAAAESAGGAAAAGDATTAGDAGETAKEPCGARPGVQAPHPVGHAARRRSPCRGRSGARSSTGAAGRRALVLTDLRARRQHPVPMRLTAAGPDVLRTRRRRLSRPAF